MPSKPLSFRLAWAGSLIAAGLLLAGPYLSRNLTNWGDSVNYSLATADAVTQAREGIIPTMVGQTRYAYNGRIHPLRTAPYMFFAAEALDAITFHELAFVTIQNAVVAGSLLASLLFCYAALRRTANCPRPRAFFLSVLYVASPPLMSAAYSFDLLMTICAAPFVPIAVGSCLRLCERPSLSATVSLSCAVAAAWLAHPPVALWLTLAVTCLWCVGLCSKPSWAGIGMALLASVLTALLSCYVFVSVLTLSPQSMPIHGGRELSILSAKAILGIERAALWGSLKPVTPSADQVSDVQLGYVGWALTVICLVKAFCFSRAARPGGARMRFILGASSLVIALALLMLVIPVPRITYAAWANLPPAVSGLTNVWPMYRLYLVALCFVIFAYAFLVGDPPSQKKWRIFNTAFLIVSMLWVAFEAGHFVRRGYRTRMDRKETDAHFRPSNIDLSITSYSFFQPSRWFVRGVSDPAFEFRLLDMKGDVFLDPLTAALREGLVVSASDLAPTHHGGSFSTRVRLMPKRHYLLTFAFAIRPTKGRIRLDGEYLKRAYDLPSAGGPSGFGMLPGEPNSISVWTDSPDPEIVTVSADLDSDPAAGEPPWVGRVALREIDETKLPIRLISLSPFECRVYAEKDGLSLETPRRYIPGYDALVNGKNRPAVPSREGQLLVPLFKGENDVRIGYPGPRGLAISFWLGAAGWLGMSAWAVSRVLAGSLGDSS